MYCPFIEEIMNHYKVGFWTMLPIAALGWAYSLLVDKHIESTEEEPLRLLQSTLVPEIPGEEYSLLEKLSNTEKLLQERKQLLEDLTKSERISLEERIKLNNFDEEHTKIYHADKAFYDQNPELFHDAYFKPGWINTDAHLILPLKFLTQLFFEHLESNILLKNYEAALNLFLSSDERAYSRTLSRNDQTTESTLMYRLGLQNFAGVDLCGKKGQPSCDQVLLDPSCACPRAHDEDAPFVLEQIEYIAVAPGTHSAKGQLEIGFKVDMDYFTIDDKKITINRLPKGEHYRAQFTRHWEDMELRK